MIKIKENITQFYSIMNKGVENEGNENISEKGINETIIDETDNTITTEES